MDHDDCPFKGPDGCYLATVVEGALRGRRTGQSPNQGSRRQEPTPAEITAAREFLSSRMPIGERRNSEGLISEAKQHQIWPSAMFAAKDALGITAAKDHNGIWWWTRESNFDNDGIPQ